MGGRIVIPLFLMVLSRVCIAGPGDTIYVEDFQNGTPNGWTQIGGTGALSVGEYAPGSGEVALTTCCGISDVVSPAIDTSVPGAQLSLRVQRGGASIGSDSPDGANDTESLDMFFLASNGSWQFVTRYPANGPAAQVLVNSHVLAPQFLHANFQVRLRQRGGNPGNDFWHLHELRVTEAAGSGGLGQLCDDFEQGPGSWTVNGNGGQAAITAQTASSATRSLALFDGPVRVESFNLDLSKASAATLNMWIRRGDAGFSEAPGAGENLTYGYIASNGAFQQLGDLPGGGTPGEVVNISVSLSADALHAGFRVQINRLGNGAGGYWHIDDVCVDIERTLDHFALLHDGSGVNCQAESVEAVAHDSNHFVVENHTGSIALSSSTAHGDWSLLAGNGGLANSGNGAGSYDFVTADKGRAILGLHDTFIETVNIGVAGNGSGEAPGEDADLTFLSTGFDFLVDGNPGQMPVQIAGKPSDIGPGAATIELQAIRTDDATGTCEAAFVGNVGIELGFSCEDPQQCHGVDLEVNGQFIAANDGGPPSAFTPLALDFGDAADMTAPLVLRYFNSGSVRLHARHVLQPSGETMTGSTSAFVVRPFGWHIAVPGNPAATGPNDGKLQPAGQSFSVTVFAKAWQPGDDADGDGVPDGHGNNDPTDNADLSDNAALPGFGREIDPDSVILSAALWQPASGTNPGLSGGTVFNSFTNGSASNAPNYTEVGILELRAALQDADYLGSGGVVSRSEPVGRFIPDHFALMIGSHGCNDTTGMSFSGQPLQQLSVSARGSSGQLLSNYDNSLGFSKNVTVQEAGSVAGSIINAGISSMDFASGVATVLAAPNGVGFLFANKDTGPATITLRAVDTDTTIVSTSGTAVTRIHSARFAMDEASAAVLTPAKSAVHVEVFDGSSWRDETQDVCTLLDTSGFQFANFTGNLDAGESTLDASATVFNAGAGTAVLTAPGAGNDGSLQLIYDAPSWLQYDWNGNGEEDPAATVRFFAPFQTERGFILRQEVVR